MADVNANIGVNIDTSDALSQLKNLQRQISLFHNSIAKSSESAGQAQRNLQKNFLNSVNAIEGFSAELRTVRTTAESFSNSLEKNKLSMREYFRYAAGASGKFSKSFAAEFSTIEKTAIERVKTLQTQYIKMGRDASGAMQAIAIRPTTLNMKDLGTQTAITAQKQVIFNQLVKQGSTNLLNFGKNTQWAGRQLMVGFTLPLATLGMTAGRVFMDMEKAAIKFKKVYGDLFTAPGETDAAMESIMELGKTYTAYGVAVSDALNIAADAAAAGFAGADLQNQTNAALKLSVLGQLELNKALETTISLQNAFRISSEDLAEEIDFLNAVENQTVVSLDDITTAVPKVAPVIQSLGGDVRDLAFFMAAMKEGGINASEGANALKSGLASLINPTDRARQMLSGFGVNLKGIIDANEGDVTGVVVDFAKALDDLDPLNRAQAIEQLFGKFQFARLSTLFANVAKDGTQASRVLDLAGASMEELAELSEKELGVAAASPMNKFLSAVENIKVALVPIGETFLQIATPIIEFGTKMLEAFNSLPDGVKKSITTVITLIGGIGPIALMTFGLINNGIANMIKFFATVRLGYLRITGQAKGVGDETQYMTNEQLEAAAAAASLDQAHSNLTQRFTAEKIAVDALRASYEQAVAAGNRFALLNPGMMKPGASAAASAPRLAKGGILKGPGNGTSDSILSWLSNGEAVIPAEVVKENPKLIEALVKGGLKIPGYRDGKIGSGAGGRVGKSSTTVQRSYGANVSATSGLVDFSAIDPNDLADLSSMYMKQIVENAKVSVAAIDKEIKVWSEKNIEEIKKATDAVNSGATATEAYTPLINKFNTDMEDSGGAVDKLNKTFKGMVPELQADLIQAQEYVKKYKLNIKESAEDAEALKKALPDNKVAQMSATPGGFGRLSKSRQAMSAMQGGPGSIEEKGSPRFMLSEGQHPSTPAYKAASSQEHFSTTIKQEEQRIRLAAQRMVESQSRAFSDGVIEGVKQSTKQASPSKEAHNAGKNIGIGAIDGIESQIDEARTAGNQVGSAAVDGVETATQTAPAKAAPRRADSGGVAMWDSQAKQYQNQAKMAQINEGRQAGLARATQMTIGKVQEFGRRASGGALAIASLAGVATMAGGKVGEFAGIVMQIAGLFGTLIFTTQQLISAQRAKAAMDMVTNLGSGRTAGGVKGPAGGFLGGAKGMDAVKNLFANLGRILGQLIPGLARFAAIITGALTAAAAALGVSLGVLLGAITAIVAVIAIGVIAYQKANEAINALANASRASAEEIKGMGELFGITAKTADLSSQFTGGAKGETSEERDATQMVLESEEYENNWKKKADAIRSASQADAQRSMESLALQLSASGFDSAAVEAIINAIVTDAGRTDLKLEFAKIDFSSKEGLASVTRIANETSAALQTSFAKFDFGDAVFGWMGGGQLNTQVQTSAAQFANLFEGLAVGFEEGKVSAEDFNIQMANINSQISSLDPAAAKKLVDELAVDLGLNDELKGLDNFEDKLLAINAATAGVEIPQKVVKALERASKAGASKKDLETAVKLRSELKTLIEEETLALEDAKNAEEQKAIMTAAVQDAKEGIEEQITSLQNEATAYQILMDSGWDAASAMAAVSDASIAQGLAMAATADERQGLINDLAILTQMRAEADARKSAVSGGGGGGGATKSAMQEALESLGKQRTEIKNNIAAYGGLRKAGFSAAEAAVVAGDATLAAALASTQVGSAKWKELVNQIRLVRVEALKTSEGIREAFSGLKDQADEYYSILEQQVERKYADGLKAAEKQAKALNRAIEDLNDITEEYQEQVDDIQRNIEIQFDRPIEALNEESSDLANDLSLMDREADKITKRYDEQAQALDRVNKINQRIIAQQKQQIGLSSALVEGDIAAAASAVQDIRASNADAAGQSQGELLDAAKQAEIDNLRSESGMSRVEIEERQFEISQEIYDLEEQREILLADIQVIEDQIYDIQENQIEPLENQLEINEDIVQAIEDQKEAELEVIDAQKQKWEDAQLALNLAKIKAGDFNDVIAMAKGLTADVVTNWEALEDQTRTLTIKTVMAGIGGEPTDAAIVQESGGGGGGGGGKPVTPTKDVKETPPKDDKKGIEPKTDPFAWLKDGEELLNDWWQDFLKWWNGTLIPGIKRLGAGFWNGVKNAATWLGEQWGKFQNWFTVTLPNGIKQWGKDVWAGMQSIPGWLAEQWTNFQTWLSELPYNIGYAAGSIWGHMQNAADWLGEQWTKFETWFTTDLPAGIDQWGKDTWKSVQDVGEWLSTQWENFKTWVTVTLPNGIKQWGADTWKNIQNIGQWLATQWENFKTWVTVTLPNGIKQWGANTWASIQNIGQWLATQWENFKTWLTVTLPNGIKNWAVNLWTVGMPALGAWLAEKAKELENWIKSLPAKIGTWAANLWDNFWSGFNAGESNTRNKATGGMIYRNRGGDVPGQGNTDTVSAMLTPGEYVVNKRATAKFRPVLKAINSGTFGGGLSNNRYQTSPQLYSPSSLSGGVYNVPQRGYMSTGDSGSVFAPQSTTATQMENPVYNYSLSVNVNGSNANADDIANTVITKIKRMDSQRLRKQVVN